ncbi:MAG: TIGR02996 domain-containing protein [Gemmataceae bacterium]|nr:TIGR02996 domain-containing protein [Gemmataceae bacterium]
MTDDGFLRAILAQPSDDAPRLVYADWLEEQGDPVSTAKAEFLRVTVQLASATGKKGRKKAWKKRLQELAAGLNTDWLAVVSHLPIEMCHGKRAKAESRSSYPIRFDYVCNRGWEDLQATDDRTVRFCDGCRQNVHYCDTIMKAREHAQERHCIAVDLGVIRREDDLIPPRLMMGRVSVDMIQREKERMKPDPVSAARERQKRAEARKEAVP